MTTTCASPVNLYRSLLLGCIPLCVAAAQACTSPAPAQEAQTGLRRFHTALRRDPLHLNIKSNRVTKLSEPHRTLLTVDVVLERADALLIQAHHSREKPGFGTGVHLHLAVEPLTGEDHRLFVTEIRFFVSFKTKDDTSRAKLKKRGLHTSVLDTYSTFTFKEVVNA